MITTPDWGTSGVGSTARWRQLLDRLTVARVHLQEETVYLSEKATRIFSSLNWSNMAVLIDGNLMREDELSSTVAKDVRKLCKGFGIEELKEILQGKWQDNFEATVFPRSTSQERRQVKVEEEE